MSCCAGGGSGPLAVAAMNGDCEVLRAEMEKEGGTLALIKSRAWTAAAQAGQVNVLRLLVEAVKSAEADVNSSMKRALYAKKDLTLLQNVLSRPGKEGMSPLATACHFGQVEAVTYLLSVGADCWQPDTMGLCPLHLAVKAGKVDVIRELFTSEPPPPSSLALKLMSSSVKYVNAVDPYGWTSLHYAVMNRNESCTVALLSHGANLISRTLIAHDSYSTLPPGVSALHIASVLGSQPMVMLLLRSYYENAADLLPSHTNAMVETQERNRRATSQPDPRLILTRTARLPYHLATRHGHRDILELLDPSIPLMFLLSGSDEGPMPQSGEGGLLNIVGVPRLTVIAASALHNALMSDLSRVEGDILREDKRIEDEAVRREAEKKLEKKEKKKKKVKKNETGSKSLRDMLGLKSKGNETVAAEDTSTSLAMVSEEVKRARAEELLRIAEEERRMLKKKNSVKKSKKSLGTSLRNPSSALSGAQGSARGVSLLQILTPGFHRRSETNSMDTFLGVEVPVGAGQHDDESAVATLRGVNQPSNHPLANPFDSRLNATLTTNRTDSGRVVGILGGRRKSDPSGSRPSSSNGGPPLDMALAIAEGLPLVLPSPGDRFLRTSGRKEAVATPSRLASSSGVNTQVEAPTGPQVAAPGTYFLTGASMTPNDESLGILPGSILTPEASEKYPGAKEGGSEVKTPSFPLMSSGPTVMSSNSLEARRPRAADDDMVRRSNSENASAAKRLVHSSTAPDSFPEPSGGSDQSAANLNKGGKAEGFLKSLTRNLVPSFLSPSKLKTPPSSAPRSQRRRYGSDSGTASGPLESPGKTSRARQTLGTLLEDDGDDDGDEEVESREPSKSKPRAAINDEDEDEPCPVCLDAPPRVGLLKCTHKLCLDCARDLCTRHKLSPALCPYCRTLISGFEMK